MTETTTSNGMSPLLCGGMIACNNTPATSATQ